MSQMPRVGWSVALALLTRAMPLLAENSLGLLALAAAMTAPALLSGRRDGGRGGGGGGWTRGEGGNQGCTNLQQMPTSSLQLLPQLKKRVNMTKEK